MRTKFIVNEPYVICLAKDQKLGKRFRGVAKCGGGDIFDVEKGKEIAKLKAEIKKEEYRYYKMDKAIRYINRQSEKLIDHYSNRQDMYFDRLNEKLARLYEIAH